MVMLARGFLAGKPAIHTQLSFGQVVFLMLQST